MIVRWASSTLNAVPDTVNGSRSAACAAARNVRSTAGAPQRISYGLASPPRHRPDTAESQARLDDRAVLDQQRRGRGGERELVGGPVAHLQVAGPRAGWQQRYSYPGDELAVLEHVLDVRPVSR